MIQLEPREYFTIARQISDPTDTNTYYVKAFIRNAKTDELIDTVELEDKGDQRFRAVWQVPADPSGQGFYITITTKVYTDSGYTSESPNYYREENLYLVQQRYNPILGGGGATVNYKKVREIVQEELSKLPKVKIPKQEKVDLSPLLKEVKNLRKSIEGIKIPEPEKVDFEPVLRELRSISKQINGIEMPGKIDLKPVLKALRSVKKQIDGIKIPKPEKADLSGVVNAVNSLREKLEKQEKKDKENEEKERRKFLPEATPFYQSRVVNRKFI